MFYSDVIYRLPLGSHNCRDSAHDLPDRLERKNETNNEFDGQCQLEEYTNNAPTIK